MALALALGASAIPAQGRVDFDALPRRTRVDSTPAARRDPSAELRERNAAQRDSIAKLVRLLDSLRVRVDTVVVAAPPRVDTVRVPVDTAPASTAATAPAPGTTPVATTPVATAPSVKAAALPPTTVTGMLQILASGGDAGSMRSSFRIRRAEIKLVSDLGRGASATVMIDVSKALALSTAGPTPSVSQGSRAIQDAFIALAAGPVRLEAGQQRLPLGIEGSHSSSILETIDRSLMTSDRARGATFGDVRDLGLMVRGKLASLEFKTGAFNGSGEAMNETDRNSGKAVTAQLIWRPKAVPGLRLGTSGVTSGPGTGDKPARDRAGIDAQWQRGRLLVQAEGMAGRDGAIARHGMYALGGWSITPALKGVIRFDAWDPDISREDAAANATERDYTIGLTWAIPATRLRLQSSLVRKSFTSDLVAASTLVHTQLQASW